MFTDEWYKSCVFTCNIFNYKHKTVAVEHQLNIHFKLYILDFFFFFKHTFCLHDLNLHERSFEMEQVSPLLYKHIFYTYGRYVHSEDATLKPIMPTCRNHFDKTGQTYNISADSNDTRTVRQAIKMWSTWRSYEAFHASQPFFEANFCSITDSRIRLCRNVSTEMSYIIQLSSCSARQSGTSFPESDSSINTSSTQHLNCPLTGQTWECHVVWKYKAKCKFRL